MIKQDIRKVILSPFFYISIILVAIFLYVGSAGESTPDFLYLYENSRYAGMISYIMPLLAGLSVADIYCVERKDGYQYSLLIRSDISTYCLSKIIVSALTGLMVALLGVAVYAMICAFTTDGSLHLATEATYQAYSQITHYSLVEELASERNWWGILGFYLLLFGTYGMIWPVMSLAAAVFTNNRYIVIAFPLLFVNLSSMVLGLLGLGRLNPLSLSGYSNVYLRAMPGDGVTFQIGMTALYLLVCGAIFRIGAEKKLR